MVQPLSTVPSNGQPWDYQKLRPELHFVPTPRIKISLNLSNHWLVRHVASILNELMVDCSLKVYEQSCQSPAPGFSKFFIWTQRPKSGEWRVSVDDVGWSPLIPPSMWTPSRCSATSNPSTPSCPSAWLSLHLDQLTSLLSQYMWTLSIHTDSNRDLIIVQFMIYCLIVQFLGSKTAERLTHPSCTSILN